MRELPFEEPIDKVSPSNGLEMEEMSEIDSSLRRSTISSIMKENEAVVSNDKKMSSYSEPLLLKHRVNISDKKYRARCFALSILLISIFLVIWLLSSLACGFDFSYCLERGG